MHFGKDFNSEQFLQKPFFLIQIEPDEGMDIFSMVSVTLRVALTCGEWIVDPLVRCYAL